MEKGTAVVGGGLSFASLLTIVFITLKLLKVITWSWGWVLAPLWITAIIDIVVVVGLVIWLKINE